MKKYALSLLMLVFVAVLGGISSGLVFASNQGTASLSTDVQQYISLSITSGSTVNFGSLTPGSPVSAPSSGTIASVSTSAANGYTISAYDGSDTNSAMRHTDTTTYIADFTNGTIATPVVWGSNTGVGITLFAADTSKEVKWGAGTTYNDASNKYAAIPAAAAVIHTASGYHASADTSSWAFKLDVPNSQKTGSYSGDVTFSAIASL